MARGTLKRCVLTAITLIAAISTPAGNLKMGAADPRHDSSPPYVDTGVYHDNTPVINPFSHAPEQLLWNVVPIHPAAAAPYNPPDYDIPLELNDTVWDMLMKMQRSGGKSVRIFLERGGFYIPDMRRTLFEEGCPSDLVYLSMIESGFNPTARSPASAAGPWQFMESTGKLYGLHVSTWVDDRLDVDKSTRAAGRHLMDLYAEFGSWPLAIAAYNAGPGTIHRATKRRSTDDFWRLLKYNDLRPETKAFVPRFYASMIIGKHPERFGIEKITPLAPASAVEIRVGPLTDLMTVSEISGAPYSQLVNLNAQYLYECTPPADGDYIIRVPKKYAGDLQAKMDSLPPEKRNRFITHNVRKGETARTIARKYRLNSNIILEANGLSSSTRLKRDQAIIIPRHRGEPPRVVQSEPKVRESSSGVYTLTYTVGDGDTLWKIANSAGVSIDDICKWNDLKKDELIHPGQTLTLHCSDSSAARNIARQGESNRHETLSGETGRRSVYHTVRQGETLSGIARKYKVPMKDLASWNHISSPYHVRVGQKLIIYR